MNQLRQLLDQIWQSYSGEAAWQAVADLSRFHRIQGSPGYRHAAQWLCQQLDNAGLIAEILSYPANEGTHFWAWPSFQEWDCSGAMLHLIAPEDQARVLADFRACPISLIQRSGAFEGEADVVLLEDGEEERDYNGLDVKGKVVLSRGEVRRVWELAVKRRGALGILYDGMRVLPPVRADGDLADSRQYTSFWWQSGDRRCFGFVLTPHQGQALRRLLKETKQQVRVRAKVDSRLYDGALEVVQAVVPGDSNQEIVVVAHLCHPQPSANDNASGAAAALEAARTLQSLVAGGQLPPPRRTIRFLWVPEVYGSAAYLANRPADLTSLVAGINLDMVGEDQCQTGASWLVEYPPEAAASFVPDLLARLRDELPALKQMADVSPSHSGVGGYPLYRQAEVPFSGGSDHVLFSDPSVGVPMPMLIQWPDRFYHTSADTPDRTDPKSLARAGSLAAIYAYWLALADEGAATWLGHEMVARFRVRLVRMVQEAVTEAWSLGDGEALAHVRADLDRQITYLLDREQTALAGLERLAPVKCAVADLQADAQRVANHEWTRAKAAFDLHATMVGLVLPEAIPPHLRSEQEREAAALIPRRQMPGTVPLESHLSRLGDQDRESWRQLVMARAGRTYDTLTSVALFWADGARSILDIAELVELETGQRDLELLLAYFGLLAKLGFVSFE